MKYNPHSKWLIVIMWGAVKAKLVIVIKSEIEFCTVKISNLPASAKFQLLSFYNRVVLVNMP